MLSPASDASGPLAAVHLDLDGARHIYAAHGWSYESVDDPLFESGLRGALEAFAQSRVRATLFVIASDLSNRRNAALIRDAVSMGHDLASHSLTHARLTGLDRAGKHREIVESRARLADTFGVEILGFRAPGFHHDRECLDMIGEAGYTYDSSKVAGKTGESHYPYRPVPGASLLELPVPGLSRFALPFHPSYSLVVGLPYFKLGVAAHRKREAPLILLFHLTDFADPLPGQQMPKYAQRLFTLSYLSGKQKREKSRTMLDIVRGQFTVGGTCGAGGGGQRAPRFRRERDLFMKAVTQNLGNGKLQVEDVPPPALRPEGLLVRVRRSLISLGTEKAVIALARKGPLGKAKDRPDLFRKVLNKAKQEGYWSTYKVVSNLMSSPIPLGYSCAGEVVAVGSAVNGFQVGDRVACAGLGHANHAEIDYIPRNLASKIPQSVSYNDACFVTVGVIALHGARLAKITLGERVVVLGLGLVGQIAAQLARCSGATVIASDLDPQKIELARRLGAHHAVSPGELTAVVASVTGSLGADVVLVCAATKSDEPMRQAAEISRLKGRVIIVGDVGMTLERRPFFEKELTLLVSQSYGPGRYDPDYELRGRDYPAAYVRWTEGRNMEAFLDLAARGDLALSSLVTHRFPIDQAETAYKIVTGEQQEPAVAILLEYNDAAPAASRVELSAKPAVRSEGLRVGVIGAGQFAKGVLLPAVAAQPQVTVGAVCTASGLTSRSVGDRYKAEYCTSNPDDIIADPGIDTVVIATRHDQHASLTAAAIRAGKAVFVEKPLALNEAGLADVLSAIDSVSNPLLMVGFNRRFAPLAVQCREFFADSQEPLFISCRVNAGAVPADSWVLDPGEGGGRILGEVCHFVDLITFLGGALPTRVFAEEIGSDSRSRQNVTITIRLANGSVGAIHYVANGDPAMPKEFIEVFGGGRAAQLDNFRQLALFKDNSRRRRRLFNQAKGHAEEVAAFIRAVKKGGPMPIDLPSLVAVTRATFLIGQSLEEGRPLEVSPSDGPPDETEGDFD